MLSFELQLCSGVRAALLLPVPLLPLTLVFLVLLVRSAAPEVLVSLRKGLLRPVHWSAVASSVGITEGHNQGKQK